ncbi:MAG: hypothetical protein ACFE8B_08160 [Candidatus Hermodarchaeota archaeon]
MAVHQERGDFIDYCHKIRKLCQNEFNSNVFSSKLIQILKNVNQLKEEAELKLSLYLFEECDD